MISRGRWQRLGKFNSISFYDSEGDVIRPNLHDDDVRCDAVYASVPYLSYGDYCVSLVEKSNIQAVEDDYDRDGLDYIDVSGGCYGHKAIALSLVGLAYATTKEVLDSLESYPIYCEDHLQQLEMHAVDDAWIDYGCKDFAQMFNLESTSWLGDELYRTWRSLVDKHNINGGSGYSNSEGDTIYFYIDDLKKTCTEDDFYTAYYGDNLGASCFIDISALPFTQLELLAA
jgi:hypothetical protein